MCRRNVDLNYKTVVIYNYLEIHRYIVRRDVDETIIIIIMSTFILDTRFVCYIMNEASFRSNLHNFNTMGYACLNFGHLNL